MIGIILFNFLITLIKIGNILVISLFLLPGHIEIMLEFSALSDFSNFEKKDDQQKNFLFGIYQNIFFSNGKSKNI